MDVQCVLEHRHNGAHDFLDLEVALAALRPILLGMDTTIDKCRFYGFDLAHETVLYAEIGTTAPGDSFATPWVRMLYAQGQWHSASRVKPL
jgi:hypothetical protein